MSPPFDGFTFIDYREPPNKGKKIRFKVLQRFLNYDTDYADIIAIFTPFSLGLASDKGMVYDHI